MSSPTIAVMPHRMQPEYSRLLVRTLPAVIETEKQNSLYTATLESLLSREKSLSAAEKRLVKLLTLLIEDFEEKAYVLPRASPLAMIHFLMDQHGLKQTDLTDVFKTRSITSEVLNGKRDLNAEQIRRLSERFHVSPELFF